MQVKNTRELIHPDKFKWKVLVYGISGAGKTEWASDAPDVGVAACETGEGNGLLTVARKGLDYVEPSSYTDFEQFCSGNVFKDKLSLMVDSLSACSQRFIKAQALTVPRSKGDSAKRTMGIPELDDYGTMGELMRKNVNKLLDLDKHIVCTALFKIKEPDAETGVGEFIVGPDLPGAMMLGSPAMFDTVMCLKTRAKLRDPKDAKSRYVERYFRTATDGNGLVAKCRSIVQGSAPLLPAEIVWNMETGEGSFTDMLNRIKKAYAEFYEAHKGEGDGKKQG